MIVRRWFLIGWLLLPVLVPAAAPAMPVRNFHQVSDRIATGGTPGPGAIAELAGQGYEVIVDLRDDFDTNEARDALAHEMSYIHVPVSWQSPTRKQLENFLRIMESNFDRKTLVHCAANYRASAMTYLYLVIAEGADADSAFADVTAVWEPNPTWSGFIGQSLAATTGND